MVKFEAGLNIDTDPTKQTQEVVFSKKSQESSHPNLYFHKFVVEKCKPKSNLELRLDKNEHLKDKFAKVNRGIGILRKLGGFLPRH